MSKKYHELYEELVSIVNELRPYYDIDKIKPYSVYVWSKEKDDDFGSNIFDIEADDITFYDTSHEIIEDALPIIEKIQYKLKEMVKAK